MILIVKRFFTTFGEPAILQHTMAVILVKDEYNFKAEGKKLMHEGWMFFYKQYTNSSLVGTQIDLSILHKNDILKNVDVILTDKFTQPPAPIQSIKPFREDGKRKNWHQSHTIRNYQHSF